MDNLNISLHNLSSDSLVEFPHEPPASDSPARKRLYFFFRGLESMATEWYDRLLVYAEFDTIDPEEWAAIAVLEAEVELLWTAVHWAGKQYAGAGYTGDVECEF